MKPKKPAHGGARRGAGRPEGSTSALPRVTKSFRLRRDLVERAEQEEGSLTAVVEASLEAYMARDKS